eukprot:3774217-Amphidinium_carterae.2
MSCKFGTKQQDFIYKDELEEAMQLSPPALSELITAFSPPLPTLLVTKSDRTKVLKGAQAHGETVPQIEYFYRCR